MYVYICTYVHILSTRPLCSPRCCFIILSVHARLSIRDYKCLHKDGTVMKASSSQTLVLIMHCYKSIWIAIELEQFLLPV